MHIDGAAVPNWDFLSMGLGAAPFPRSFVLWMLDELHVDNRRKGGTA
jgi:hypothetical protein